MEPAAAVAELQAENAKLREEIRKLTAAAAATSAAATSGVEL